MIKFFQDIFSEKLVIKVEIENEINQEIQFYQIS